MPKEVRVALVMGGGVSLGSFSGGALAELVRLLAEYPADRGGQPLQAKLDVLTGASAGAMTLALLLRYLQANADADELAQVMSSCWVDGVGLDYPSDATEQLLPDVNSHCDPSLLRDRPVRALARRFMRQHGPGAPGPSPLLGERVYLSFAVANMNGVDVRLPWQTIRDDLAVQPGDDALVSTFFDDRVRFVYDQSLPQPADDFDEAASAWRLSRLGDPDHDNGWRLFEKSAIASGAFPLAFPPVRLRREQREFGELWPDSLGDETQAYEFSYLDGGLFRNEPLKEAIDLAAIRDAGDDPATYERVFLLIDPNVSGSLAALTLPHEQHLGLKETYTPTGRLTRQELVRHDYAGRLLGVIGRTISAVVGQATARDWIRMRKVNFQLQWAERLEEIALAVAPQADDKLRVQVHQSVEELYAARFGQSAKAQLERDRASLKTTTDAPDSTQLKFLVDLRLLLRNATGNRDKRRIKFVAITPWSVQDPPARLAGNFALGFGGFLRRAWRDYDFKVGRRVAHEVLMHPIEQGVQRLVREDAPAPPPPPDQVEPSYQDADRAVRDAFESALHDHVENLVGAFGVSDFVDDIVAGRVIHTAVEALRKPAGAVHNLILRFSGPGLERSHYLQETETGDEVYAFRDGGDGFVIETVIAARHLPDAGGYVLEGPHLQVVSQQPVIRIMRDQFGYDDPAWIARLKGDPQDWFERARRDPLVPVSCAGNLNVTVSPDTGLA